MEEFLKKFNVDKSLLFIIGFLAIVIIGWPKIQDKMTNKVFDKLTDRYNPSPFSSGFDPSSVQPKETGVEQDKAKYAEWKKLWNVNR